MVQGSGAEEEGVKLKLDDLKPLPLGVTGTPELRHPAHSWEKLVDVPSAIRSGRIRSQTEKAF